MVKFGILCPPFTGHLNPMLSLALEIKHRGHEVTLFHYYHTNEKFLKINRLGIKTVPVCDEYTAKIINDELVTLAELVGWKANDQTIRIYEKLIDVNLHLLPKQIKKSQCNALLIDQSFLEGESLAFIVKLPFINICNALMLNPDVNLPPIFMAWQPNFSIIGLFRNLLGYLYLGFRPNDTTKLINTYRKNRKISPYGSTFNPKYFTNLWSKVATITQQPDSFEFPRKALADNFYFTGPFINSEIREEIEFPWSKLNGKPLIYASLGTLQNSVSNIFGKIAQACIGINCQLIIALGKQNITSSDLIIDCLPQDAIVVSYAPQLKLLKKASLTITHAGLNTSLESLANGVPIVAIPIANDQPGVAARIKWTKTGKILKLDCKISQLTEAIEEVLADDSYRYNAVRMQQKIKKSGGIKQAADVIEFSFS